ncbi:MAG: HAMP domain-containing sensor histidine kinase [Chitinophagaceae bacterium]
MKGKRFNIFRRIAVLVFSLITILGILFIAITYFATTHYHQASLQLLNKEVAAHIAKFTSPFERDGINLQKADSVFHDAMVLSPSVEVYFLDTTGKVIAFHASEKEIKLRNIPLANIHQYIEAKGEKYIKAPDPRDPSLTKIFSAAEVYGNNKKFGYIYVILGSKSSENIMSTLLGSHISNLAIKAFAAIIILSIAISIFYLILIRKTFNRLIEVLQRFENGDYTARFEINDQDELAPVTTAFNKMADLLSRNIVSLTKSEHERKDFVAAISHDLRTPLAIARGYAETLAIKKEREEITAGQRQEYVQLILQKIHQVEIMVQQLFELSRIEAAEFKPRKEPFVLSEIVQEIINTFQLAVAEKGISLQCTQCQYHMWVHADVGMMERAVQNLIDNALKSTPAGGSIQVSILLDANNLVFSIANTGRPMPEDLIQWINTFKDDNSLLGKRPGKLGLGLLIVQKILLLHNSSLAAYTHEGTCNVFTFPLPVYNVPATG